MIVGGWDKKKLVQIYDINRKSFKPLKSTLYERWGSTSVKINSHVYTAGGCRSNFVECLNLNQVDGDWYKVASMNERRQHAASAVLNGWLIFIFNNILVDYYCRKCLDYF
ncbi:kelch-like protein 12 [Ciona intestinalis]